MSDTISSIQTRATAKAGPLPVYGWVLIIAGAAYAYYKFIYSKKASTAVSTATTTTTPNAYTSTGGSSGVTVVDGNTIPPNLNIDVQDTSKAVVNYVRDSLTGSIWSASNGSLIKQLSFPEYQALGSPSTTPFTPNIIRNPDTGEIDQEFGGTRYHLTYADWTGEGSPAYTDKQSSDPVWQEPTTATIL